MFCAGTSSGSRIRGTRIGLSTPTDSTGKGSKGVRILVFAWPGSGSEDGRLGAGAATIEAKISKESYSVLWPTHIHFAFPALIVVCLRSPLHPAQREFFACSGCSDRHSGFVGAVRRSQEHAGGGDSIPGRPPPYLPHRPR